MVTAKGYQKANITTPRNTIWPNWNISRLTHQWEKLQILQYIQSQLIFAAIAEPQADLNLLMDEASKFLSKGLNFGNRESMKKSKNSKEILLKKSFSDR